MSSHKALRRADKLRSAAGPAKAPRKPWIIPTLLGATFLVYLPTFWFGFVYDDQADIVGNTGIQSWEAMPGFFFPKVGQILGAMGWHQVRFYRPVYMLWLRLNHAFFALDPVGWHVAAVLSHLLATLLVYLVVRRLLADWRPALLTGLLFGLHPIHVQVVSWLSVVSESLLCSALLASLLFYLSREGGRLRYTLSLLCCALALLVKETAVVFPAIIIAAGWLFGQHEQSRLRRTTRALVQSLPYLALSLLYLAARWAVLKTLAVGTSKISSGSMFFTIPSLLWFYLRLLLWPVGLSPLYNNPVVRHPELHGFVLPLAGLVLLAGLFAVLLWRMYPAEEGEERQRWRLAVFAVAFIVFLLPALNLPALPEEQIVQDRYLYLPSIGFVMLLALALHRVGRGGKAILGWPSRTAIPALIIALLMAGVTLEESQIWKSQATLFTRAAQKAPHSKIARANYAGVLMEAQRYDESIAVMKQILADDPYDPIVRHNLVQALGNLGRQPEVEALLVESSQHNPLAVDLYQLGVLRVNARRAPEAEELFRHAIQMDANAPGYHLGEGVALLQLGRQQEAAQQFRRELEIDPSNEQARSLLAQIEGRQPPKP